MYIVHIMWYIMCHILLVCTRFELLSAARAGEYGVVFAAPPCSTFSVARLQYARGPPQLRSMLHPRGVPGLPESDTKLVEKHNLLVDFTIELMRAAAVQGASLAVENPVPRGDPESPFFQVGLSDHASLWDVPEMREFMTDLYMLFVDFPQCALHADYQKYTRLAFTPSLKPMLQRLTALRCKHSTHTAVAHGFDENGESHSNRSSLYPPALSAFLAQTFATDIIHTPGITPAAPAFRADLPSDELPPPVPPPHPSQALMRRLHIDTMAPYGVTSTPAAIVRIQEMHPGIFLAGVAGSIPIVAVVTVGFHVRRRSDDHRWMYLEIPDCYYAPQSTIELYPVQHCFELLGWRHAFDDQCTITVTGGYVVPFVSQPGKGYSMQMAYDTRRVERLPAALRVPQHSRRPTGGRQQAVAYPSVPVLDIGNRPRQVDLVWRRLGYPSSDIWRRVHSATVNSGLTAASAAPRYTTAAERLAVARARMRAGAFPRGHSDDPATEPLYKLYMDFDGPIAVKSHIHGYRLLCGVVDGYSGLGGVLSCRSPTAAVAVSTLSQFLIYCRVLLRSSVPVTPTIVRTDQGSAFTSSVFRDYVRSLSAQHSLAVTYAPQQNSLIERAWGTIIFNIARILLHTANLSVVWTRSPLLTHCTSVMRSLCQRRGSADLRRSQGVLLTCGGYGLSAARSRPTLARSSGMRLTFAGSCREGRSWSITQLRASTSALRTRRQVTWSTSLNAVRSELAYMLRSMRPRSLASRRRQWSKMRRGLKTGSYI